MREIGHICHSEPAMSNEETMDTAAIASLQCQMREMEHSCHSELAMSDETQWDTGGRACNVR
ncbi:hypothetical protein DPMN_045350 [Dreissena polymorpha]|uniref:Uncharacterized protein n=1 Tax=Dreissena polymorpha TaxID=45954 RepID=A0A9D4D682_DREPO|nr:hypothetical protein DPMN_045350 [Dreissena polymorpha]